MLQARYKTKKALKASIGQPPLYVETSLFGKEYQENGTFTVVGLLRRNWFATVTMKDGLIAKVS